MLSLTFTDSLVLICIDLVISQPVILKETYTGLGPRLVMVKPLKEKPLELVKIDAAVVLAKNPVPKPHAWP
jgi:hypothetical protein